MNMKKFDALVGKWSVSLLFLLAATLLVPTGLDYERVMSPVKYLTPELAVDYDTAMNEMDAMFIALRPYQEWHAQYPAEVALQHRLRALKVERYYDEDRYKISGPQNDIVHGRIRSLLKDQTDSFFNQYKKEYAQEQIARFNKISNESEEFLRVIEFRAHDLDFDSGEYAGFVGSRYPYSMLLAGLGFIGLMRRRKLNVLAELFPPFQFALALVFWPVALLVYPYQDPKQQVTRVVNFAATALSFLLSCSGMAVAQTVKAGTSKKTKSLSSFQVDARVVAPLVDDPDLTVNVRGTLNTHRVVVETITVANTAAGVVYNETGLGVTVQPGINVIGLVTKSRGNDAGWAAGLQIFKPLTKKIFLAIPVLRYESGGKGFLVAQPAFAMSKRWLLTPEVSVKVAQHKRPAYGVGVSVRWAFGRKFVEGSLLHGGGVHSSRLRYSQTTAF